MKRTFAPTGNVAQDQGKQNQQEDSQQQTKTQDVKQTPSDLNSFLLNSESLKYRASYSVTSGIGDQIIETEITTYNSAGKKRIDTLSNGKETRVYTNNDMFYQCSDTSEWKCYSVEQSNDRDTGKVNTDKYNATSLPDRQIGETLARCFMIEAEATVVYCFSSEGVPLYTSANSTRTFSEMKAESYSTQVDDSVFELPASPTVAQQGVFIDINETEEINETK